MHVLSYFSQKCIQCLHASRLQAALKYMALCRRGTRREAVVQEGVSQLESLDNCKFVRDPVEETCPSPALPSGVRLARPARRGFVMQRVAWLQTSAHRQRASPTLENSCMRQQAAQRMQAVRRAAGWQCRSRASCPRERTVKAHTAAVSWPELARTRPQRTRASVILTAAAAATASSGSGAQQSLQQTGRDLQPQQYQHSRQSQQWSPGFGRLLWQQLAPDWWKLLCVAAFTFVSVVATVSVGPAVGRGPSPCSAPVLVILTMTHIRSIQHLLKCSQCCRWLQSLTCSPCRLPPRGTCTSRSVGWAPPCSAPASASPGRHAAVVWDNPLRHAPQLRLSCCGAGLHNGATQP